MKKFTIAFLAMLVAGVVFYAISLIPIFNFTTRSFVTFCGVHSLVTIRVIWAQLPNIYSNLKWYHLCLLPFVWAGPAWMNSGLIYPVISYVAGWKEFTSFYDLLYFFVSGLVLVLIIRATALKLVKPILERIISRLILSPINA